MTPPPLIAPQLRHWQSRLQRLGYKLTFRSHTWVECFARRPGERWLGRGDSEDEALDDLLQQMLPSHVARTSLDLLPDSAPEAPQSSVRPSRVTLGATWNTSDWADTDLSGVSSAAISVVVGAPGPSAAENDSDPTEAPPTLRGQGRKAVDAAETLTARTPPLPSPSAAEALVQLANLLGEIEQQSATFVMAAAERQRMHILAWICRARGIEDNFSGDHVVENAVQRIVRRLTEFSRLTWPGSVHALKVIAEPEDLHELFEHGRPARTWADASTRADQRLASLVLHDRACGCDEYGWADAPGPPPSDPGALLQQVALSIGSRLGVRDASAAERIAGFDDASVEELVRDARLLRWLRGADPAPHLWGAAIGQLRFACAHLGARSRSLREVLDARTRPHTAWYVEEPKVAAPRAIDSREALIADLPSAPAPVEALTSWLEDAFGTISKPDIAQLVAPHREQIVALEATVVKFEDRRMRRHMRHLIGLLGPLKPVERPGPPVKPELLVETSATDEEHLTTPESTEQAPTSPLEKLAACVREVVGGKRTLFVSNREDRQLELKLKELMALNITWCEGSPRRVQAQCRRILKGSYDVVLCASGFQDHTVVHALARATTTAEVPYVLVQRGRSRACLTAVAKAFNVAIDQPLRQRQPGAPT